MPEITRPIKMTVRLSNEEEALRNLLEAHFGTDGNGVMRMGMLTLARKEGIALPENKKEGAPKRAPRRK